MIGAFVCGGLGNQMFQYATGRALALRNGTQLQLDLAAYGRQLAFEVARPFELDRLAIETAPSAPASRLSFLLARRARPALNRIGGWQTLREASLGFDPAVTRLGDGAYLFGYWQSWRYFEDYADPIRAELQPRHPLSEPSQRLLDRLSSTNSLAIHVRRGDYLSSPETAQFHGALAARFYEDAVAAVQARSPELQGYVFSDDLPWCRDALAGLGIPLTFVDVNNGAQSWQDLYLMAACRHAIIANSSFSWWAAWLGDGHGDQHRVVVAPQRWFAGAETPIDDRCPPGWLVL